MSVMREQSQTLNPVRHWRFTAKNYDTLLPPEPLAEHLEPQVAIAGMRHCMTLRKAEGHLHSAWHHVEYAMNQLVTELDESLRQKYIDDASYLIATITNANGEASRQISPNLYAQAMTLNIFLPIFTKRALNVIPNAKDCNNIYVSFGHLFDTLGRMRGTDSSYRPARFAEMNGFALSARSLQPAMLLHPASPREEASAQQVYNHDGYFIRKGQKLRIQSKLEITDKDYLPPTNVMYMEPLALHALKRAGCIDVDDDLHFGDATLMLSELITRETVYGDCDESEKQALDFATRSIVGRCKFSFPEQLSA